MASTNIHFGSNGITISGLVTCSGVRWNFCPDCGMKLEATWNFCGGCGKRVEARAVTSGTVTYTVPPQGTHTTTSRRCAFDGLPPGAYSLYCDCPRCSIARAAVGSKLPLV